MVSLLHTQKYTDVIDNFKGPLEPKEQSPSPVNSCCWSLCTAVGLICQKMELDTSY